MKPQILETSGTGIEKGVINIDVSIFHQEANKRALGRDACWVQCNGVWHVVIPKQPIWWLDYLFMLKYHGEDATTICDTCISIDDGMYGQEPASGNLCESCKEIVDNAFCNP